MNEDDYPSETLELVYNEVKDALNTQIQSLDGLNTKASVHSNSYLFGSCMTLFLTSIFFTLCAYRVKSYRRDPEPRTLTEKYLREGDKKVKKQLIDNFIQSFEDNKTKIEKKVKYINYSIILLFIGLIVLTLSIIME
jgi:hypothetical protein